MQACAGTPWAGVVDPPVPGRVAKPRSIGLTMVLDKGLGLQETRDWLDVAAAHVDLVKLTFGTSACYRTDRLQGKLHDIRGTGVDTCPGGTLLEVAVLQGRLERYLERAANLGFTVIEVSDGVAEMDPATRRRCIQRARLFGFKVTSEVGKKLAAVPPSPTALAHQAVADLEAGAWKVIVEARESGRGVGIFDQHGTVRWDDLEMLVALVPDLAAIWWEAPLKDQQVALLRRFGPNVNLGNVSPADVLALEATRLGLRADTLPLSLAVEEQAPPAMGR